MVRTSETVRRGGVEIETYVDGNGSTLVILPSYGRDSGEDYDDITARTARAGWQVLRTQPRGVAGSRGPMSGVTLHHLADDVAAVIRTLAGGRAVLLGHAFGHALARMVATDHPDLVTAVILAALIGVALSGAICGLAASLLSNFAAYAASLAGYTVAIIAGDASSSLDQVFVLAVSRASEIAIG